MSDETKVKEVPVVAHVPMFEKRKIEAAILKNVHDVLTELYDQDIADEVISKAVIQSAIEQGQQFREEHGGEPNCEDFAALGALWEKGGVLERRVLNVSPDRYEFDMVRCDYADMYKNMGLAHIGHLLSCNRDATFCQGYNPKMKLTRTQTIMKGAPFCDFRYRMETEDNSDKS